MHETESDLERLQALLDASYAGAGEHLLAIHTPERRLTAAALTAELTDMRLLVLATTTASGRPVTGAVDGFFHRGAFWFGSSPTSARFTHLAARPAVSATHLPGEHLAVTVHGRAVPIDVHAAEFADFRRTLLGYYIPRYGAGWESFLDAGVAYARIDADRMFTFSMPEG